jgi:Uri superfamily endonuclease
MQPTRRLTSAPRLLAPDSRLPASPGTYALLLRLERQVQLEVGRLGELTLPAGWYVYVGSALAGLGPRLARHLRRDKPKRWHVDYLRELAEPVGLAYRQGPERRECQVVAELASRPGARPVLRFGASDCRCPSHLIGFSRRPGLRLGPGWIGLRLRPETSQGRILAPEPGDLPEELERC